MQLGRSICSAACGERWKPPTPVWWLPRQIAMTSFGLSWPKWPPVVLKKVVPDGIKLSFGVTERQTAKIACIIPNQSQALKFIDCISDFKIYLAIPFLGQPVFDTSIDLLSGQPLIRSQQKIVRQHRLFDLFFLSGVD
jgi:hypothetical protein